MPSEPRLRIVAHGATHPGRVRQQNEDSLIVDYGIGLFAVADGMGGHNAGEVASSIALETIRAFIQRSCEDPDQTWPFGIDPALDINANRISTAIKLANRQVYRESGTREEYAGMGTTIAAVLVEGTTAAICGVGDSRVCLVHRRRIERLTHDHTWVQVLLAQNPELDPKTIADHPMRHVLTRVVGVQEDIEVAVLSRSPVRGERYAITSDGVHGPLEDARIAAIVSQAADVRSAADQLVAEALERDGSDNLTALVLEIESSTPQA